MNLIGVFIFPKIQILSNTGINDTVMKSFLVSLGLLNMNNFWEIWVLDGSTICTS